MPNQAVRLSLAVTLLAALATTAATRAAPAQVVPDSTAMRLQLQSSLDAGMEQAKTAQGLDAAYELLGVADAAIRAKQDDIAAKASESLIDVVRRATEAGAKGPVNESQDTIDQLLDLKFSAGASGIENVIRTLDDSMKSLIPRIASELAARAGAKGEWDERVQALASLGDLQSSAAQATLSDEAVTIGATFDRAWDKLKAAAEAESDAPHADTLIAVRQTRDERLADAVANNVRAVAEEMRASGENQSDMSDDGGSDFNLGLTAESTGLEQSTCVETGFLPGDAADGSRSSSDAMERDCALSGRTPSSTRCTTRDLSFVCYENMGPSESITYVYRNTPEEEELRRSCGAENLLDSGHIPGTGALFRNGEMKLSMTCAPVGERAARD